jgi:hypothetical protein
MAGIGSTYLDLIDFQKRENPNGEAVTNVIEVLAKQNPILQDAVAVECNMGSKHRHTIRTGLPTASWGTLYAGVAQSKSTTQTVDDTTGFLEAMSSVDTRLLALKPKSAAAIRLSEADAHLEGMNQEMGSGIFYHDTATSPTKFKGLATRYGTLAGSGAGNQIIDAGGSGSDNTSIWFVSWGAGKTTLLYPEGTQAGVLREDKGEQRVTDASGNPYYVKEEKFTWHMGVAVGDWRFNSRVANIDVSNMQAGSVDLYTFMRKAYYKLQSRPRRQTGAGTEPFTQAIYCNRDVLEALDGLATNGGSADNFTRLRWMEIQGDEVLTYRGIPIRETDSLLNAETRVV